MLRRHGDAFGAIANPFDKRRRIIFLAGCRSSARAFAETLTAYPALRLEVPTVFEGSEAK